MILTLKPRGRGNWAAVTMALEGKRVALGHVRVAREPGRGRGMAIAANLKVLNDNIQVEINAAKLALATEGKAHSFGQVVGMGRRLIASDGCGSVD